MPTHLFSPCVGFVVLIVLFIQWDISTRSFVPEKPAVLQQVLFHIPNSFFTLRRDRKEERGSVVAEFEDRTVKPRILACLW